MLLACWSAGWFAPPGSQVASWWPAAGIAGALVVLAPRRALPWVVVGIAATNAAGNLLAGRPPGMAYPFALLNAVEAALVGGLLRRAVVRGPDGRPRLVGLEAFVVLLGAAVSGALVVATGGAAALASQGLAGFAETWNWVAPVHAASILVVAPAVLALGEPSLHRRAETAVQVAVLAAVTALVFAPDQHLSLAYVPLAPLVWAGLRLGVRTTALELLGVAVLVTWSSARGGGPFVHDATAPAFSGALTQSWLAVAALLSLPLALAASQRNDLLKRVVASERRFRDVFRRAAVGMLVLHCDGEHLVVDEANPVAHDLLGAGRLPGQDLPALVAARGPVEDACRRVRRGLAPDVELDVAPTGRPGTRLRLTLSLVAAGGPGRDAVLSAQLVDVTSQRRSHDALVAALRSEQQAGERLRSLDRAKDDFVSTVSHELRTPVTSIVGYTEMLQDGMAGDLTPQQVSMVAAVERNGRRLIALTEDLLALARLESGAGTDQHAPVDLRGTVAHARDALAPLLAASGLDLAWELPDDPVVVVGDEAQLDRAVVNLLSNALKFTTEGRVRVAVRTEGPDAVVEVEDTGMGIPADEQDALFQRFFRSSTGQAQAVQGTGLGLAIVAAVVQAHGGSATVDSREGAGTTVRLRLLLAPSPARPATLVEGSGAALGAG